MKKNKLVYILVATLFLASCGSSSMDASTAETAPAEAPDYGGYDSDGSYATEESAVSDSADATGEIGLSNNATEYKREAMFAKEGSIENIIKNSDKDFDETLLQVESYVDKYDGYFENAEYNDYGSKYFSSTIKVPVKDFENLFKDLKSAGSNVYNESTVVNEAPGYYSLKSQLEVRKLSKDRLEELLETTTNSKDLLKLYDRYFDLVAEIETMESKLSHIESTTTYSTIYFVLNDGNTVTYVDDVSFMSKIKAGFSTSIDFIENLIINLAYISIPLILALIICFFAYKKVLKLLETTTKHLNPEDHVKLDDDEVQEEESNDTDTKDENK